MKITALSLVLLFSSLILFSCKKDNPVIPPEPPPVDYRKITLADEGKSCTEIWIKITADSVELPSVVTFRVNSTFEEITLSNKRDSVVYLDSLQTNSSYRFSADLKEDTTIKSTELRVNTLAPTSHSFTYQTWEFGDIPSSYLYGATIVNDKNIWAVGKITIIDSSGNDIDYNALHWDGTKWELKQIMYYTICGQVHKSPYPIGSIIQVESQLWAMMQGNEVVRISDTTQVEIMCLPFSMGIYSSWGNNSNNVFAVGNLGKIAKYDGSTWQSITSPTTLALTDIYSNGNGDIYAAGVNTSEGKGVVLKGNEGGEFNVMADGDIIDESELFNPKLYGSVGAVWVDENNIIYTGGNLLYRYKNNSWNYVTSLPENFIGGNPGTYYRGYIYAIRGNAVNDYLISGDRNTLKHFNGIDWEQLGLPYDPSSDIVWRDIQMQGNTAIAVGNKSSNAFIILLNR